MTTETTGITAARTTSARAAVAPSVLRLSDCLRRCRLVIPCALISAGLATVCLAPSASAHGGGGGKGYRSSIVRLVPASPFIHVTVVDSDDRLQLRVDGIHGVVINGYEGEPYLRFTPSGVYRNRRSPATYLNDDRFGKVRVPATASPAAAPQWERVASGGGSYEWHDHRIHWMNTSYPPVVVADRGRPHRISDWAIPGTADGKPFAVQGHLDYVPLPGQRFPRWLIIPLAALVLLAVALPLLRHRSTHRAGDRLSPLTHDGPESRS